MTTSQERATRDTSVACGRPELASFILRDYLDILTDIVEKYEADEHPMPPVSDAAMLHHLIEFPAGHSPATFKPSPPAP